MRTALVIALVLLPAGLAAAQAKKLSDGPSRDPVAKFQSIDNPRLPNAYRLTDKVISGGQPAGEQAFADLAALGVKTIISVDGAKPDVLAAKKHGLRYVHLPHGYDGVPDRRLQELAKAVRDLPGPVYIHCHHGKHRSPAAAAAACVSIGALTSSAAQDVLVTAGTSPNYRGLYDTVRKARPVSSRTLDQLKVEFHETEAIPPLADAMVAIEHHHDHLKSIAAANWKSPPDHPDLDPPHEALLLSEQFTELLRSEAVAQQPAEFKSLLREGEAAAQDLEALLREEPLDAKRGTASFNKITANCQSCHQQFRDVPLGEKAASKSK
jgi:protein tyrosine phosphatase (PTP) superfamily phosphohydrolase (DUF442 family)